MKYLFFLLLVLNIALYLWETGAGREKSHVDRVALALPDETERLVLIEELPAAPRRSPEARAAADVPLERTASRPEAPSVESPEPTAPPKPVDPSCFRLGPYHKEAMARAAQEILEDRVGDAEVVTGQAETVDGYWVLYPKAESVEAARLNRAMLQGKGIRDLWVFDKGELTGAISLGLYQSRERAEIAQKQFFAKNLKVEIVPRTSRSTARWVRMHWEGERAALEGIVGNLPNRQTAPLPQLQGCD